MPLVYKTKIADVSILISLGNTWLVLKTTSATSIFSSVFGAYSMTRILYKCAHLPTLFLFSHFHLQRQHSLSSVTSRENTLTLSISTNRVNTLFLLFTFDFQQSTVTKMDTFCNHSLPHYTLSVRLSPALNTEISSNHRKKQTAEILS